MTVSVSVIDFIQGKSASKEADITCIIDDSVNSEANEWIDCVKRLTSFFKSLAKTDAKQVETCSSYTRAVRVLTKIMPPNEDIATPATSTRMRKLYQDCIVACLQVNLVLSDVLHRRLIQYISRHALSFMPHPLLLCQFFLTSLDAPCKKTATAALVPLVQLMVSGGLGDIPELFPKLFNLISPETLPLAAPRKQLLSLLSRLLESSLIPEKWVAAFLKRLARVAVLCVDHSVALWAVTCVYTLAQKNQTSCKPLFHSNDVWETNGAEDVFNMNLNLADAARLIKKTCLWEINLLLRHGCPAVARLASLFKTNLFSVSAKRIVSLDFSGLTDSALFERERKTTKRKALELSFIGGKAEDEIVRKVFRRF